MRVGNKGRVTIPADLRRLLGIEEGDEVLFFPDEEEGRLILKKRNAEESGEDS